LDEEVTGGETEPRESFAKEMKMENQGGFMIRFNADKHELIVMENGEEKRFHVVTEQEYVEYKKIALLNTSVQDLNEAIDSVIASILQLGRLAEKVKGDYIKDKNPVPRLYLPIEGVSWIPWDDDFGKRPERIYAIAFENGEIFDTVNGWRKEL
jgi:hypothetical protein